MTPNLAGCDFGIVRLEKDFLVNLLNILAQKQPFTGVL